MKSAQIANYGCREHIHSKANELESPFWPWEDDGQGVAKQNDQCDTTTGSDGVQILIQWKHTRERISLGRKGR